MIFEIVCGLIPLAFLAFGLGRILRESARERRKIEEWQAEAQMRQIARTVVAEAILEYDRTLAGRVADKIARGVWPDGIARGGVTVGEVGRSGYFPVEIQNSDRSPGIVRDEFGNARQGVIPGNGFAPTKGGRL